MKSILTLAAVAVFVAVPAFAADQDGSRTTITKGTKSYQSSRSWGQDDQQQAPANTASNEQNGDVSKIEPAAGGNAPAEAATQQTQDEGQSFREDMRLPRKN